MAYVDGYVLVIPKKKLAAYRRMALSAGRIWRQYGALEFRECVGDDLNIKMGKPFSRLTKLKRGEAAIFSWIVYKSRVARDRVNAKVMKDPRILKMMKRNPVAMDMKRFSYGGFKTLVDLKGRRK
jgi:uncharacterized protein YbaA (DUF1428 family)